MLPPYICAKELHPTGRKTKGYHPVSFHAANTPSNRLLRICTVCLGSKALQNIRIQDLPGQSLKPRQLHFLLVLPKLSSTSCSVISTQFAPFSFSTSGKSSRYRRTLPVSLLLSSKKLKRLFRRHQRGASRRHIPRKPRQDLSISRYSRRRVDGNVQSMTVAGTWFSYWCCRFGFASSAGLMAKPCSVVTTVDGTWGRFGSPGDTKDLRSSARTRDGPPCGDSKVSKV